MEKCYQQVLICSLIIRPQTLVSYLHHCLPYNTMGNFLWDSISSLETVTTTKWRQEQSFSMSALEWPILLSVPSSVSNQATKTTENQPF